VLCALGVVAALAVGGWDFIERNTDGRPFDHDSRTSIYERAKGTKDEQAYGTERDVREPGYEWLLQSMHPFVRRNSRPRSRSAVPTADSRMRWRC